MSTVSWLYPFWVLVCLIQTNAKLCILSGIYRVNYNTHNWELLATTLKENPSSIHHLNRAQVIKNLDLLSFRSSTRSKRDSFTYYIRTSINDKIKLKKNLRCDALL